MIVIKFGGSLMDEAFRVCSEIPRDKDILIVPGGGVFADFIREKNLDDDTAHFEAIEAMQRFGRYLSTFGFPAVTVPKTCGKAAVFLPYDYLKETDALPHSWEVTSDSLAAWIAASTNSPLILAKSVDAVFSPALKNSDVTDSYIFKIAEENPKLSVKIVNARRKGELLRALCAL